MTGRQTQRVLVAVVAETRAWELTAESFMSNVLDELHADLALCVGDHEEPNPLYDRARFVWRSPEPEDWGEFYDMVAGGPNWRVLLEPGGQLLGGIEDPDRQGIGSGAIVLYYRQFLKQSIERSGVADDYDWLIVTRSDLLWPVPHPSTDHLSKRHIYLLDGEGYGGAGDRHAIVPRRYLRRFLEVPDPIFSDPKWLRRRLDRRSVSEDWDFVNPERFLASRLKDLGLWRHVRFLPYVAYAVRAPGGSTRWSEGVFDEARDLYIKYPSEFERSSLAMRYVNDQDSWRRYLAPIRGVRARRRLRAAYRGTSEPDEYRRRPFQLARAHVRAGRTAGHLAGKQKELLQRLVLELGKELRRIPGMTRLLDARIRRMRRRAERR
jgi:hypothetical protein